jgi:predicted RecA/RadA family phage recombinase
MKNFVQFGETLIFTVPAETTITSGDLVVVGDIVGVAVTGGVAGDNITLNVEGVYSLPKSNVALALGDRVYAQVADDAPTTVVATAGDNIPVGIVWAAAAAGAAFVDVKLNA